MRAVIQRVSEARVTIDASVTGEIGPGMLILLGIHHDDTKKDVLWLADKIARLRIFVDDDGKMNRNIEQIGGSFLVVSQFTLYASCKKGNRPAFLDAALPDVAIPLYEQFLEELRNKGIPVEAGVFGAKMDVSLCNDGPVTLLLET